MNKTNIYVSVRTEEECKAFFSFAEKHKQPIFSFTEDWLSAGMPSKNNPFIHFQTDEWVGASYKTIEGKTPITLSELESMLCGKGEEVISKYDNFIQTCPLCNSIESKPILGCVGDSQYRIKCVECNLQIQHDRKDKVISEWNKRNFAIQQTSSLMKELEKKERFTMPTPKQIIDIAVLFNDGKLEREKLSDMVGMCDFIIDRLYENGDITKPSSKENSHE